MAIHAAFGFITLLLNRQNGMLKMTAKIGEGFFIHGSGGPYWRLGIGSSPRRTCDF
jgi:hypothetical protein